MKLLKKNVIVFFLLFIIYIVFFSIFNNSYAGYITVEEANNKMPGIADLVNNLKSVHSNYNFQFYDTGLDWNTAILREYQGHGHSPTNLFNFGQSYSGMWYCPVCGTKIYDNGTLSCASQDAIKYMMDPRNSVTEGSVFQFKSLETATDSYDDIARVCSGTFLNNGECVAAILEASQAYNINAFYLVAKILTEQGANGTTLSNGITVNGNVYYNLFNIGAFGSGSQILINGGNYAASRGWTSRRDSILGGAQIVKDNYIGKGQNTCYYQKYNVVNTQSGLYSHQYAQNILAAENEGSKFRAYYNVNGNITGNHTFIIPVYNNMPQTACGRPSVTTVNSITYETGKITANGGVRVRAGEGTGQEQIGTIAQNVTVKILARGANVIDGHNWDLVISDNTGLFGYVAKTYVETTGNGSNSGSSVANEPVQNIPVQPNAQQEQQIPQDDGSGEKIKISENLLMVSALCTLDELKQIYPDIVITEASGEVTTRLATGCNVTINGGNYKIIKKGDVNGDGEIDVSDVVLMLNHIKRTSMISDEAKLSAGKISGDVDISVTDVVKELNYIKRTINDILVK